ncbi:MAG: putative peptidyl-prolyl cis-trans isomerase [Leptospiraceae bacterium]|nr:putative peptidyl-prolyl cis-trans isomerase [Leptospiraceae bacterium]MCP5512076.1 putative peptidyl-prolyl cis-trans isomerase [Leptospiraceae bacterium]
MKILFFFISVYLLTSLSLTAGETINRIIATIGQKSVTQMDYDKALEKYKLLFKNTKSPYKGSLNTQIIDFLISRLIIEITSDEETITVTPKRIESEISRIMENSGISDRLAFEKHITERMGIPFQVWEEELPYQIMKNQLIQVRVPVRSPTEEEIQKWYNQNKSKIGFEFKYREIAIVPKNKSFDEEDRVSNEINQIKKEIRKDKSSFNLIASGPRNNSFHRNGFVDWTPIGEIFKENRFVANYLMQLKEGTFSDVFRDEKNRYCIIKVEGKRFTPLEVIRRYIQNVLQGEKIEASFDEWILERRKELPIFIYDKSYLIENKLEAPDESFNANKLIY